MIVANCSKLVPTWQRPKRRAVEAPRDAPLLHDHHLVGHVGQPLFHADVKAAARADEVQRAVHLGQAREIFRVHHEGEVTLVHLVCSRVGIVGGVGQRVVDAVLLREGEVGGDVLLVEGRLFAAAGAAGEVLEGVRVDGRRLFGHLQIAAALREMATNGQHDESFRQRILEIWSQNRVLGFVSQKIIALVLAGIPNARICSVFR